MISVEERIKKLEQILGVDQSILSSYLSVSLGPSWIISKNISTSEVELSMTLKAIRKILQFNVLSTLNTQINTRTLYLSLRDVYKKYFYFYSLHQLLHTNKHKWKDIKTYLSSDFIFDLSIARSRFYVVLQEILTKISPQELELLYRVNTIYRLLLAYDVYKESRIPIHIRGSLLFFHARSFGIGYGANFLGLENTQIDTYNQATGSDLDIRILNTNIQSVKHLKEIVNNVNNEHKKHCISFIMEIALMNEKSLDDAVHAKEILKMIEVYKKEFPFRTSKIVPATILSMKEIRKYKKKYTKIAKTINLTFLNIDRLCEGFNTILLLYKANDEVRKIYYEKWRDLLLRARMDTNFNGNVSQELLKDAFRSVFLFSGYRFSTDDEEMIFSKIIKFSI